MKCGNSENLNPRRETLHPWCRQAWIAFRKNRSFPTLHDFDCELSEGFLESLLIVGASDWLRSLATELRRLQRRSGHRFALEGPQISTSM